MGDAPPSTRTLGLLLKAYKLKYKDDEGDQITMSTDRDLANAVAYTKTLEPPVLRLTLEAESLELAIIEGNVDVVKALLESGAPLEEYSYEEMKRRFSGDGYRITPLELAIAKGNVDVVNALLKSGAPLEGMKRLCSDGSHITPLELAIIEGNDCRRGQGAPRVRSTARGNETPCF